MSMFGGPTGNSAGQKMAGYNVVRHQKFGPQQMELFERLFSQVGPESQLAQLAAGSEEGFRPHEQAAQRDFQKYMGQMGSRFAEMAPGAQSARRSSGFGIEGGEAAQSFAERLAGQRQQLQRQAIQDLMGISKDLLGQDPYETYFVKPSQQEERPWWEGLVPGATAAAGAGIGGYFGGPQGAMLGGTLGQKFGKSMMGR